MEKAYYDPNNSGAYGGVDRLWRAVKGHTRKEVQNWLKKQDVYTLNKPARRTFTRQRVMVAGIDEQWQADLVDIPQFVKQNSGFRYLLTVIDVFSKYAWVVILKSKSAQIVVDAVEAIFKSGRSPKKLQTDRGTEFYNSRLLVKYGKIVLFSTHNSDTKAFVVELFNIYSFLTVHSKRPCGSTLRLNRRIRCVALFS